MQIQTHTNIFLSVHCLSEKKILGQWQQKFKKKIWTVLKTTNVWNNGTCVRFLQILWYCLWKLSNSVVMCWILWDGMSTFCTLYRLSYTVAWVTLKTYQTFYCRVLCYQVWVWLCQLFPSRAERNIGRFACLPFSRFDSQHSEEAYFFLAVGTW